MKRLVLVLARALRRRCPACGAGPLFKGWFEMRARCPGCDLLFEREEGYFLGAMALNIVVAEGLFVAGFAAALIATWPKPPWELLTWASVVAVVLFPMALYPYARTVWLAFDLVFRPVGSEERRGSHAESAPDGHSNPARPRYPYRRVE
jgi:uncharacterized protein (DUF983 family)